MISFLSLLFLVNVMHADANIPEIPSDKSPGIIMSSPDGGMTWTDLGAGLPQKVAPISLRVEDDTFYLGAVDGLYVGKSSGSKIEWKKERLSMREIIQVSLEKHGSYAIGRYDGLSRNTASGWESLEEYMPDKRAFDVCETKEGAIIAGCGSGIYRSSDSGKSWKQVLESDYVFRIIESQGVLIACSNYTIWRSTDDGKSWLPQLSQQAETFELMEAGNAIITIASGHHVPGMEGKNIVHRSTDKGVTWEPITSSLPAELASIHDMKRAGKYLVACSGAGIFRSSDNGATWETVYKLPKDPGGFFRLAVSGDKVYTLWMMGC